MSLQGKIALVTGASRGLGQAIAQQLGSQGATVIGTATSPAGADAIQATFDEAGISGHGMVLDVTDGDAVTALIKELGNGVGAPQILINNAGITRDTLMMRMKIADWQAVIDTNLTSVFRVSQACLKGMMKARWGRIVNISSVVGLSGNPGQVNYSAAKSGLLGFSKSMAREVASRGITVNLVAPGFIDTDMTRGLSDAQREALLGNVPAGRLGEPADIAAAVGFLVSEQASYITGETINVNGGLYMN